MDIEKSKQALKNVHKYLAKHNHVGSATAEKEAETIIKGQCPELLQGHGSIHVGYSDEFNKKIFYVDVPKQKKIFIYSPILDRLIDLFSLNMNGSKELAPCQKYIYKRVQEKQYIDCLLQTNLKPELRIITALFAGGYNPTDPVVKGLLIEIMEDHYSEAIVG